MWRDDAYLLDILLAARKIVRFSQGYDAKKFNADEVMQHAVMRLIQIIGEAARKISPAYKDAHPQIPWTQIIDMRNRLVHEYFRVETDIVWEVVEKDIPALIPLIEPLVPPE
ncbi:MAG: DUF86 domain-containing protein [Desulfobacteraceae bacterium]